jgi:two-component system sensor histidine kinase DesK
VQEIADVERTARSALAEVRETIGGYRARGLPAEMDAARNALTAAGVHFEVEGLPAAGSLRPAEETVLALALREAVTNVVRHAQARTCRLRFTVRNGRHLLAIEDDGQHSALHEGNGLRGMRERVESLGGTFQLEREHGTRLLIELPAARSAS